MVRAPGVEYRFFVFRRAVALSREYGYEAVALAVIVVTQIQAWTHDDHTSTRVAVFSLLTAGPLLFRRRAPFVAPLVTAAGGIAFTLVDPEAAYDTSTLFFVLLLGAWAAGTLPDARQAGIALGAILLTGWLVMYRAPDQPLSEVFWVTLPLGGVFALAAAAARHSERARRAEERAQRTEEEALRAVEEERSRITRELHDVLAHSVSVMTVQASAVRRLLKPEQEREREALLTVEETGRQALAEMRRLLGIMRTDSEPAGARAAAGARHAAGARRAGAPVGAPGRADGRGHAGQAPGRGRSLRVPDRAGGADEHAAARRAGARVGRRPLRR